MFANVFDPILCPISLFCQPQPHYVVYLYIENYSVLYYDDDNSVAHTRIPRVKVLLLLCYDIYMILT